MVERALVLPCAFEPRDELRQRLRARLAQRFALSLEPRRQLVAFVERQPLRELGGGQLRRVLEGGKAVLARVLDRAIQTLREEVAQRSDIGASARARSRRECPG